MAESMRLPVLGLLGDALRDVFGNPGELMRIAWPYYALAVISAALPFALASGSSLAALLGPGTASILVGLAILACSVKWQRHVTLAEPLQGIAPLNLRVLRYTGWSAVIGLLCALPLLLGAALAYATGLISDDPTGAAPYRIGPAGIVVGGIGALAGALLFLRLSLVLPAISADDRSVTMVRSWQLTRGNALRLFAALLLLTLGLAMLGAAMGLIQSVLESAAEGGQLIPALTGLILQAVVNLVASMAGASLIASAYVKLAGATVADSAPPR